MKTHKELQDEFDRKVAKLQKECKHPKLSNWMQEWWAIAHPTGYEVKRCEVCSSIVNRRINCSKCNKIIEEKDFVEGDGKTRPGNEIFCQKCEDDWKKFMVKFPYKFKMITVTVHPQEGKPYKKREELGEVMHFMGIHDKFMGRG